MDILWSRNHCVAAFLQGGDVGEEVDDEFVKPISDSSESFDPVLDSKTLLSYIANQD